MSGEVFMETEMNLGEAKLISAQLDANETSTVSVEEEIAKDPLYYKDLIFGVFDINLVLTCVNDAEWQAFRISMKGQSTVEKLKMLRSYVGANKRLANGTDAYIPHAVAVRVTNYIYALKRGGQLK